MTTKKKAPKRMDALEKNKLAYKRQCMICDIILLGFTDPICQDYPIPNAAIIEDLVDRALKDMEVSKAKRKEIDDITFFPAFSGPCFDRAQSVMENHLTGWNDDFNGEWFYGKGMFYRYLPSSKERALKNTHEYFKKKELDFFEELNIMIQSLWKKDKKRL